MSKKKWGGYYYNPDDPDSVPQHIKDSKTTWGESWNSNNVGNSIGTLASGIVGITKGASDIASIKNTAALHSMIDSYAKTNFDYNNTTNLLSAYNPNQLKTNYRADELQGNNRELGVLNTTATGAAAGASIGGPVGALVGGAVGLLGGIGGILIGDAKARKEADKLNREAEMANQQYIRNFADNASKISTDMFNNSLLNLAADGGFLTSDGFPYYNVAYTRSKMGNKIKSKTIKYGGFGNYYAYGGNMHRSGDWSNGVTIITEGDTHEKNPYGGVPMGQDNQGVPNLVEEGEVIFNDYVYSNRLKPTETELKAVNLNKEKYKDKTYAEIAKDVQKESEERPNDPISKNGLVDGMVKLMTAQEMTRAKKGLGEPAVSAFGGHTHAKGDFLRYAPIIGSGIQAFSDAIGLTNREDFSVLDDVIQKDSQVRNVSPQPIGNYLTFNPFDVNYEQTRLGNQSQGTQRNVLNTTSGNRGAALASLLALNSSTNQNMGALYRQAKEYNDAHKAAVEQFNAGISQFNAQQALQADVYNQRRDQMRVNTALQTAQMRDAIQSALSQARSTNYSNFLTQLGQAGKENTTASIISRLADVLAPGYNRVINGQVRPTQTQTTIQPTVIVSDELPSENQQPIITVDGVPYYDYLSLTPYEPDYSGLEGEEEGYRKAKSYRKSHTKKCGGKLRKK